MSLIVYCILTGLLDNADVNHQVCPVLEELTAFESVDDFRTEAVALMTRLVLNRVSILTCVPASLYELLSIGPSVAR